MDKRIIRVGKITEAIERAGVPLSTAIEANGFVFVSGLPPLDRETGELVAAADIETQTRHVLENIKAALEAAGSSLDKVVKVNVFITNSAYFERVNDVYRKYFAKDPPARTFVAMSSWPWEFDIEIECVALA